MMLSFCCLLLDFCLADVGSYLLLSLYLSMVLCVEGRVDLALC